MKELSQHGNQGRAAAKAGVCRQTAAKYQRLEKVPSEFKAGREWRTRPDPFAAVWPALEARLREAPGLWARTLLEELQEQYPGQFSPGQLRTLHRRVQQWRALHGDDQAVELFFPQQHRPGEAGQVPEPDRVRELVRPATAVVPALAIPAVELASYDALLGEMTR